MQASTKRGRRPVRRGVRRLGWEVTASLAYSVRRDDAVLAILVSQVPDSSSWVVAALEVPKSDAPPSLETSMAHTFANHAHQTFPAQETLPDAMALAEDYGAWWQGSRATHFKCACTDIAKTAK